jgi:hypothetical protein
LRTDVKKRIENSFEGKKHGAELNHWMRAGIIYSADCTLCWILVDGIKKG